MNKHWVTEGFADFRAGEFGNGGQNLYVSKRGVLQRIFQFDLLQRGYFDLVFANCQNHHESMESFVYDLDGNRTDLPGQGAFSGIAVDLNGDGYHDIVIAGYHDMAAPFASTDIYFGSAAGYSENRHIRIPTPYAEDVCAGNFKGDGKPALVFAMPIYGTTRIFYPTELGVEWNRFVDLPICAELVLSADLDGDGCDELIIRRKGGNIRDTPAGTISDQIYTGATVYWGGPNGIDPDNCTVFPEFSAADILLPEEEKSLQSEMEKKFDAPRLIKKVRWQNRTCFAISSGKKIVFVGATAQRELETVLELAVPMALSVAVGDISGNGYDDIAVACRLRNRNDAKRQSSFIFWNDADGVAADKFTEIDTRQACDVAVGDLNHDGCAEVLFCQASVDHVYTNDALLFFGQKGGMNREPRRFPSEDARRAVLFTNPDGIARLLLVNHYSRSSVGFDKTYVYTGAADGYSPDRRLEVPGWCAVDSIIADFDDDGRAELLVCNNAENSLHLDPGHYLHHFDANGLVPERTVALQTDLGWGAATGDFRHSGYLDIATPCSHWRNIRVFNNSAEGYTTSYDIDLHGVGSPRWILAADLDQNGYLDLIVPLISSDRTLIFRGGPEGYSWENHYELAVLGGACARVADLSGNGYLDLLIGTHTQTPSRGELKPHQPHHSYLHIYWNGPEGLRENNKTVLRTDAADALCVGDFNNDGWPDVFAASYHGGKDRDIHSFIYWNRAGHFQESDRQLIYTHSASGCIAADFNEDGWVDLAVANHKVNGDHLGFSSVWYNRDGEFDKHRRIDLPTAGPHGMSSCEPGNALRRQPEEYYTSTVFELPQGALPRRATLVGEIPPKCWVKFRFRSGATREALAQATWSAPFAPGETLPETLTAGGFIQYQLELGAINSLRTPRITRVDVEYC